MNSTRRRRRGAVSLLSIFAVCLITLTLANVLLLPGRLPPASPNPRREAARCNAALQLPRCPTSTPFRQVLNSRHTLHTDGNWSLAGLGDGHHIHIGSLLRHIAQRRIQPVRVPAHLICHKGMTRPSDAAGPFGLPEVSGKGEVGGSLLLPGGPAHARDASAMARRFAKVCHRLEDGSRMAHACVGVPGILARTGYTWHSGLGARSEAETGEWVEEVSKMTRATRVCYLVQRHTAARDDTRNTRLLSSA